MRQRIFGIIAAAAFIVAGAAMPARAEGALVGTGIAAGANCPQGALAISGVSASFNQWTFTVQFAGVGLCALSSATVVTTGTWNPALGGCVPGSIGTICVGAVPVTLQQRTVAVSFCGAPGCFNGSASVTRA